MRRLLDLISFNATHRSVGAAKHRDDGIQFKNLRYHANGLPSELLAALLPANTLPQECSATISERELSQALALNPLPPQDLVTVVRDKEHVLDDPKLATVRWGGHRALHR